MLSTGGGSACGEQRARFRNTAPGPILRTVTDMCGFLLASNLATALFHRLGP
jgi:hypothetical protein